MVKVWNNKRLRELGYRILLQIHDEIIMEGPEEHAEEALNLCKRKENNRVVLSEDLRLILESA